MMTVSLFACSKNSEQNNNEEKKEPVPDYPISEKYGEQIYTYRMFEIPVATGYPQLSMKDLSDITPENINERINTYADLLNYLTYSDNQNYNIDSERVDVSKASNIISGGEYEEVGIIDLTFKNGVEQYLYIKADGKYYPLDLARQGASVTTKWLAHFEDGQYVFDDLDKVIKAVSDNFPYKQNFGEVISTDHHSTSYSFIDAPNGMKLMSSNRLGEDMYFYEGHEIPLVCGLPELTKEDLVALDKNDNLDEVAEKINTYADLLAYKKMKNGEAPFDTDQPYRINEKAMLLLGFDYDEVGRVNIDQEENNHYSTFYIKVKDKYYVFDIFLDNATNVVGIFNSKEDIENHYFENQIAFQETEKVSFDDFKFCGIVDAPNGMTFKKTERFGEEVIIYCGYQIPIAYGLPKLTYNEIDALIKEAENGNYEAVKEGISTITDFACFLNRYGFSPTERNTLVNTNAYTGSNVGNIVYRDDPFCYTISGTESLMVKIGQCTSMSALFQYILAEDYDELGYVDVILESDDPTMNGLDGHVFIYVKTNGRYYIANPMDYGEGVFEWMMNYDGEKASADTLEELMDYVYDSTYPLGTKMVSTIAFVYDGSYTRYRGSNSLTIPADAELKYSKGFDVRYGTPKHPTNHEYIIGVKIKQ